MSSLVLLVQEHTTSAMLSIIAFFIILIFGLCLQRYNGFSILQNELTAICKYLLMSFGHFMDIAYLCIRISYSYEILIDMDCIFLLRLMRSFSRRK